MNTKLIKRKHIKIEIRIFIAISCFILGIALWEVYAKWMIESLQRPFIYHPFNSWSIITSLAFALCIFIYITKINPKEKP